MSYADEVRQMFRELEADGTAQRPFQIDDFTPDKTGGSWVAIIDGFSPSEIDRIRYMNSLLGKAYEKSIIKQLLCLPEEKDEGEGEE